MRLLPRRALAAALLIASPGAAPANDIPTRPLPEARPFLEAVRDKLKSDQTLLSEYTFLEKHVQTKLDAKGGVKSTKTETYEVYPSSNPGRIYRRLVAIDGKPVDPKDLAESDRKQDEKTERKRLARENETPDQKERRSQRQADNLRKEKAIVEELFQMDDIRVVGREMLNGRSTVLVTFHPREGFKPRTKGGKVLQKIAGQAWIDEEDQELVRIDAELLDGLGVGPGGVFRLQKGARAFFERRRVNDEIWLPAEARFTGAAKVLLFRLGRLNASSLYSDYRKFSVSTEAEISDVEKN
ncbi:MAG TPA: hypothetical protein VIB08_00700 [Thermoanaerobaculia bacterium]